MKKDTYNVKDATLIASKALPSSAGTVQSAAIDLGDSGKKLAKAELAIEAPALTTTQLPDAATITYAIEDSADNSTFATVANEVLVQTGAGGAGAESVEERVGIKSTLRRYVRLVAKSANTPGDCSGAEATLAVVM